MPTYAFFQPPSEPSATSWEFRFLPVSPVDGWPLYGQAVPLDGPVTEDAFLCAGEFLREWCRETLPPPETLEEVRAFEGEVEACMSTEQSCNRVVLDIPAADGYLQAQACGDVLSCSVWSKPLVVPEFDFFAGLLAGILLVGALYERSWKRRNTRSVRGVRINRQRSPVRRWLRKVLHSRLWLVGGRRKW